jgi:hypothetical protein
MDAELKSHLAKKLTSLLDETGETQASLARFCSIKPGLIADHIRSKAYPRMALILKYWQFFKNKLDRPFTLYELTGLELVKELELDTRESAIDGSVRRILESYANLSKDDPRKKAIDALLLADDEASSGSE